MALMDESRKRLLVSVIDSHATNDPKRVWASAPIDDDNLTKGFKDITYKEFANAINRASWWLKENTENVETPFETVAYAGPKDLRYPILAVAALKCGKKLLLPSPFASHEAQMHVLGATQCKTYLHAASFGQKIESLLATSHDVRQLEVPELQEWLFANKVNAFPYNKTWEEAESDPWLIFHTSGTTGLPRPIIYTNLMMTSFDAAELMPDADGETFNSHIRNSRWYTPLPSLHFVGMTISLQWTTFLNTVLVVGPPDTVTAPKVSQVLEFGKPVGVVMPPSLIETICRYPDGLEKLRKLNYIYFAGAPLSRPIAEQLVGNCKVQPAMGSTEAGAYFIQIRNDEDWEYYRFRPAMGAELEQRTEDLYELVFKRQAELERWQQLFHVYPDLNRFETKDLWTRHPLEPDLWRFSGRADDLIILSHGEGLYASDIETEIQNHPDIRVALLGGQGRPVPFLILDLVEDSSLLGKERAAKLTSIWPSIAKANEKCSDYVKLTKDLVLFTDVHRPLPQTAKETVARLPSFELYSADIDALYKM